MKQHYVYVRRESPGPDGSHYDRVEVGFDQVLGEAVLDLVESGIDEDAHFWGSGWQDIDDDELEAALADPEMIKKATDYIREGLTERLYEALAARRDEATRHPKD